jgi:hypothetical protein
MRWTESTKIRRRGFRSSCKGGSSLWELDHHGTVELLQTVAVPLQRTQPSDSSSDQVHQVLARFKHWVNSAGTWQKGQSTQMETWSDSKLLTGAVEGWDSVLVFLDPSRHDSSWDDPRIPSQITQRELGFVYIQNVVNLVLDVFILGVPYGYWIWMGKVRDYNGLYSGSTNSL